jgi:signal transduction histidine kinase
LDAFLFANRDAIIARADERLRTSPTPPFAGAANGIPAFLSQLADALRLARSTDEIDHEQISKSARLHGHDLLRHGLTIAQVVHVYGDVCQAVTELAVQQNAAISGDEFRTLNLCLDDAIAGAVTEYSRQRELANETAVTERLGHLAHELRNLLNTAMLSFDVIRSGSVAPGGATSMLHGRSLLGLRDLVDRALAEVRLDAGLERAELISVAAFVEKIEISAMMLAQARAIRFVTSPVDCTLTISGDRQLLVAALSNLVQNAFKFTHPRSSVSLTTHATVDRVLFDVEDECGGLPPGKADEIFLPFVQHGADRSGMGLGLSICRRAAEASGGEIRVRDLPGKGCIFTLDLPRKAPPPLTAIEGGKGAAGSPGSEKVGDVAMSSSR